ncbi:MAG TPA: tripartite tricarboxylate transporter substrate binding protein [Casimicrobiaceae bacterium]|nr:tripartite tricarboxylate transporter substrate binding protein [Casimicrobiaceae bacterium]
MIRTPARLVAVVASAIAVACASLVAHTAAAQGAVATYPSKAIRLVVPFPPGAGTDAVARLVAQKLGEAMAATIVIDNRSGAGGAIGAAEVARAEPDGYTLLFVASPFTTVAAASKNAGYDPLREFVAVAPIAAGPLAFVVNADFPAQSMRDFIALARDKPGSLNYGSAGTGSVNHLALELLKARTGVDIVHVPYKGIAPAMVDLVSGRIEAITASIPAALPFIAQHKLRALALTGPRRSPLLPGVPTWKEAGIENAEVVNYWGIVAPAGTPQAVVDKLNTDTRAVLAQPEVRERLEREGADVIADAPGRLASLIETDLARWKRLIVEAGLTLD